jgi:rhodanese-related sulfurtransferase
MLDFIKKLFGGAAVNYASLMAKGAQIIDVRSKSEFNQGHIGVAKNISLDTLPRTLPKINKAKPVITCCASGARSARAKNILLANGFKEVYNGGGWQSLNRKLKG